MITIGLLTLATQICDITPVQNFLDPGVISMAPIDVRRDAVVVYCHSSRKHAVVTRPLNNDEHSCRMDEYPLTKLDGNWNIRIDKKRTAYSRVDLDGSCLPIEYGDGTYPGHSWIFAYDNIPSSIALALQKLTESMGIQFLDEETKRFANVLPQIPYGKDPLTGYSVFVAEPEACNKRSLNSGRRYISCYATAVQNNIIAGWSLLFGVAADGRIEFCASNRIVD